MKIDHKTLNMDNDNSSQTNNEKDLTQPFLKKIRYRWLDEFRGFCIFIYAIAVISYALSVDVALGEIPVFSPYLNHGWALSFSIFGEIPENIPIPITIVDIGQVVIICLVGLMQAHSYRYRINYFSKRNALMHLFNRFTIFLGLSVILEDVLFSHGIYVAIFDGVLANIAWASLIAGLTTKFISKPKFRVLIGGSIMLIHFFLYEIQSLRDWSIGSGVWFFQIPWRTFNLMAIGIIGAAVEEYLFTDKMEIKAMSFKSKILPLAFIFLLCSYITSFFQFLNPITCNSPHALLGLGSGFLGLFLFYSFNETRFHLRPLEILGKNMFLIFLISPIFEWIWIAVFEKLIFRNPFFAFLFAGFLPISILFGIAYILEIRGIQFKL